MQLDFPAGSVVTEVHYLEFRNEKELEEAAALIRSADGPLVLPDGQILPWTNGMVWWIAQLTRIAMGPDPVVDAGQYRHARGRMRL